MRSSSFSVVVAAGVFQFAADLLGAGLDVLGAAGAFDDRGVVFVDHDFLGLAQIAELDVVQLHAQVFKDRRAAYHNRDVLQHGFAAVAVTGGFDGHAFEGSPQLVDYQRRQGFAFHVFGNDKQGAA